MDKKAWLDKLFYERGKQGYDYELACLTKEGPKSKWRKYLDIQADEKFIATVNNRTIFANEFVIDIEDADKFSGLIAKVKKDFQFYSVYKTGSRGFHIHLFFDRELSREEKGRIIKKFNGDPHKASKRN